MRLGRKLLVIAAFAAFAAFVMGGTPAAAHDGHPDGSTLHRDCTWTVDKQVWDGHAWVDAASFDLAKGQQGFSVQYRITLTATCVDSLHDGHGDHSPVTGHGHEAAVHGTSRCVTIADPQAPTGTFPASGLVCADHVDEHGKAVFVFEYSVPVHTDVCGDQTITNTVTVTDALHHHVLAQDSVTVTIHVLCPPDGGCTLTQGYWKTHGDPANTKKFDTTWNLLPGGLGPNTTFFLSGASWIQVFNTSPSGNAYYQLAHQYMAASLNILNGASAPASVTTAISSATTLFNTYTPAQIGALKGSDALRQQFISLAGTLGSYNEGTIGPGHCDE